jgi:hypothetical protein
MARQPAHKAAPGYKEFWRIMVLEFGVHQIFTIKDIWLKVARANHGTKSTIRDYLNRLAKGGYVEKIEAEGERVVGRAVTFRLLKSGLEAPRLRKDGTEVTMGRNREQMWRTMKMGDTFSAADLAINASTADVFIKEPDAKDYIKHLHRAGYLALVKKAKPGCNQARYRLIPSRNTGPQPPQIQRIKQVFDPNLNKVVWQEGNND